ncbi:hypothetical protein BCR43DRAFT_495799 [Syncephalastrum racemosum]|uniref:Uncharacterized protein n=1 Tax=Syncephalastrum racemosum TaxID=13706 RepID=A0A1X2H6J3_SYNRA|nr:hypothetical protein BCR43DRAFT_495799 [Syncephalastrum racemosum]
MNPEYNHDQLYYDEQQQQQQQQYPPFVEDEYQELCWTDEAADFGDYDRAMAAATLTADYYDAQYYDEMEYDEMEYDEMEQDDDEPENQKEHQQEEYDYEQDSLLHLIVGVQSYLKDVSTTGVDRNESPLLDLQYKMYTYLKQRACEMGIDTNAL